MNKKIIILIFALVLVGIGTAGIVKHRVQIKDWFNDTFVEQSIEESNDIGEE